MFLSTFYNRKFFKALENGKTSADELVPIIVEMFHPKSVVDVGCGIGVWLKAFKEHGINQVLGIDGNYVDPDIKAKFIESNEFEAHDLSKPLEISRYFDLCISLEVAEHLPESSADVFVDSLTKLAPIIIFSAAIPHQGGTHHVNEQPPGYWIQKFKDRNYNFYDPIRNKIWNNSKIAGYYKQNIIVFINQQFESNHQNLIHEIAIRCSPIYIVHPDVFAAYTNVDIISRKNYIIKILPLLFRGFKKYKKYKG